MATALTYYTELQEPTVNGDVDLWGAILNATNAAWDRALAGIATASLAAGDWTPTTSEGECLVLKPTGILPTDRVITVPAKNRRYVVWNTCTGAFTVTIKTASGVGYVCPQGIMVDVYCDGTDMTLRSAGGGSGVYPIGTSGATVPLNNGDNTSSGNVTYSGTSTFTGSAWVYSSTDAGATAGPALDLYRDSATPAAADILAEIQWNGRDSAANKQLYVRAHATITDATSTSEDATWDLGTVVAGTMADRVHVGAGLYSEGVTGGDKGAGSANFTTIYQANTALGTAAFVNTGTSGATIPLLNGNNTYSGTSSFTGAVTMTGANPLQVQYNDDGATSGPQINVYRNSASPAASDLVGRVAWRANDSGANVWDVGSITGRIVDPTDGSEDGEIGIRTTIAGAAGDRVWIGAGLYSQGVTGGDKGAGSANFTTIYLANAALTAAATTAIGTSGATIPLLNGNNTYSGTSAFTGAVTMSGGSGSPLSLTWVDAGAGAGPDLSITRDSSSPAASDALGRIIFYGRDSATNLDPTIVLAASWLDPTSTSEDSKIEILSQVAGSQVVALGAANGIVSGAPTGSYQGTGTVNATAYYKNGVLFAGGAAPTIQVFTSSTTWSRPTGCTKIKVTVVAAGGGGGGADGGSASDDGVGGGGGAGGYAVEYIDVTALSSASVVVGAAGTAGSNSGGTGGTGGTSSFGTGPLLQATGGAGGVGLQGGGVVTRAAGGAGGAGSGGDINGDGGAGTPGFAGVGTDNIIGGTGGSSILGGGGRGSITTSGGTAGNAGGDYGGGGGGASSMNTTSGAAGGVGGPGVVIVEEYY